MNAIKCSLLGILGLLGVLLSTIMPLRVPFASTLAKTYRREAIVGLVVMTLSVAALVTAVVKLFDPNQFKGPIVRWVHERTQRDLVLDGELTMSYFPKLGLETGKASLSQRRSAREFASVDNARVTFAWWPLLRRELQIDSLDVQGLRAQLVRFKDGSSNVDDLARDLAAMLPTGVALDSLRLSRGALRWNDEITWQRGSLNDLQLEIGRLADGQAGPLTASARVDASLAGMDAQLQLKGRVLYDAAAGRVELARTDGRLEGRAFGVDNLTLNLQGDVTGLLRERSLAVANLAVTSLSKSGLSVYNAKLTLPELRLGEYRVSGAALGVEASVDHPDRSATLALQLLRFEWAEGALRDTTAHARLTLRTPAALLRAQGSSALRLTFDDGPRIELGTLELSASATHAAFSAETAAILTGRLDVHLRERSARAVWSGKLAGSDWRGDVTLADFGRPRWTFDVEAERLDLDALLSPTWLARWGDDSAAFDLGALRDTTAQGRLRIGKMVFGGAQASAASARVELDKSLLLIEPIAAQLYDAPLDASLRIEAAAAPRLSTKGSVAGLAVRNLLADAKAVPWLDGRGNVNWDVSSAGASLGTLRSALTGTLGIVLQSGAVAGVDLRAVLHEARADSAKRGALAPREFDAAARTPFSELKARIELHEGRATGQPLELSGPALRVAGDGELLLDTGALELRLLATSGRDAPEAVPLQVRGPWRKPGFSFDAGTATSAGMPRVVDPGASPLAMVSGTSGEAGSAKAAPTGKPRVD